VRCLTLCVKGHTEKRKSEQTTKRTVLVTWVCSLRISSATVVDLWECSLGFLQRLKFYSIEYAFAEEREGLAGLSCAKSMVPFLWGSTDLEWTFWSLIVIGKVRYIYLVLAESWGECGLLADGQTFFLQQVPLENPPWSSETTILLIAGSSLWRPFLFVVRNRRQCVWIMWDPGDKAVFKLDHSW